jgi:hypothetical protein
MATADGNRSPASEFDSLDIYDALANAGDDEDADLLFEQFKAAIPDQESTAKSGEGTPLHVELAELRTLGIVSNFGISKNLEIFEQQCSKQVSDSQPNHSSNFTKSPELFLQRDDDSDDSDCCLYSTSQLNTKDNQYVKHNKSFNNDNDKIKAYHAYNDETIFETTATASTSEMQSSFQRNHFFNFIEPNTSFHSVSGYDNEQLMFEGTIEFLFLFTLSYSTSNDQFIFFSDRHTGCVSV